MNDNYDAVIQLKKDNLAERVEKRGQNIARWMGAVRSGDVPPFLKLDTENHKAEERKAVADAVGAYREERTPENENAVKKALDAYYDAFLAEQKQHIAETEDARAEKMAGALERFTDARFRPGTQSARNAVEPDDALAEIICLHIAAGAEIVPVNPEARVRERTFNRAIDTARKNYFGDTNETNRAALKDEIAKAFQTAYEVRVEGAARAEKKGADGARALLAQFRKEEFRAEMFGELTGQRNLYGRIDRMVTFGGNTASGNWEPRMKAESRELARLLREYENSPSKENESALEAKFVEIYKKMLHAHKEHLAAAKSKLDSHVAKTLGEIAD